MTNWLLGSDAPAWIQAVGSVAAIVAAVLLQNRQRRISVRDAAIELAEQERRYVKRLIAGLRAEIRAAIELAAQHEEAITAALKGLAEARDRGADIAKNPIQPGSMTITDGIIYREVAADLGRLPVAVIEKTVSFYSRAFQVARLADGAPTAEEAYSSVHGLMPRIRMDAAMLIRTLDKFEKAGLSADTVPSLEPDEIRELAKQTGYPLDELLRQRGFQP